MPPKRNFFSTFAQTNIPMAETSIISKATKLNWKRLNADTSGKLTHRANKTLSSKRVVANGYLDFAPANLFLDKISCFDYRVEDVMFTLCLEFLRHHKLDNRTGTKSFISQFSQFSELNLVLPPNLWESKSDILGFIYQSLLTEGERIRTGQYYTPAHIVDFMLGEKKVKSGETLLDPCCGSGAFLLGVETGNPLSLYGFDINPVAVMITGTNLLAKYAAYDFVPNVYCINFLKDELPHGIPGKFDNICTNPPWGSDRADLYRNMYPEIMSKELASMVAVKCLRLLGHGELKLLLPTALLRIKSHRHLRKYLLQNATVKRIDLFSDRFDGVFTDYFSISMQGSPTNHQEYDVTSNGSVNRISLSEVNISSGDMVIHHLSKEGESIIQKMEARRHDDLTHSQWALGIVTGNNKEKVFHSPSPETERIYRGKDVSDFRLSNESVFIHFDPRQFQQCANQELYRAPEKLIYRFIAKFPVVAYDTSGALCLNSANILIPHLNSISIKSAAALLNSSLYRFFYSVKFPDIKVLKGNLQSLPFPKLTAAENSELEDIVNSIMTDGCAENRLQKLDQTVYRIFNITANERNFIEQYGKTQ